MVPVGNGQRAALEREIGARCGARRQVGMAPYDDQAGPAPHQRLPAPPQRSCAPASGPLPGVPGPACRRPLSRPASSDMLDMPPAACWARAAPVSSWCVPAIASGFLLPLACPRWLRGCSARAAYALAAAPCPALGTAEPGGQLPHRYPGAQGRPCACLDGRPTRPPPRAQPPVCPELCNRSGLAPALVAGRRRPSASEPIITQERARFCSSRPIPRHQLHRAHPERPRPHICTRQTCIPAAPLVAVQRDA